LLAEEKNAREIGVFIQHEDFKDQDDDMLDSHPSNRPKANKRKELLAVEDR
jgi:hypothetical protein|tara:strand:+ start:384 stop:536 length:153 start_codon:yes stop_codon:yes gene_type:complete